MTRMIEIYAHRGYSGEYPENTMAAFEAACKANTDGIELDVQLSKDGEVVVIHDERIDRTTNGIGYVKDLNYRQLKLYDAGSWFDRRYSRQSIPLLSEVLKMLEQRRSITLNIELKNNLIDYDGLELKVLELLDETGLRNNAILSTFNSKSLIRLRELDSSVNTALLFEGVPSNVITDARNNRVNAVHCEAAFAMSPAGKRTIEAGYPLRVFTVNEKEMLGKLEDAGVSAIMSDFPGLFN